MAAFPTMTLTNAGQALQTKVQAGATLTFTRIALGDGQLNGQPISPLTALISQKASVEVDTVRVVDNSTAQASGFFSNADITTGFWWRETGLFAQDPDNGEILYGYTNAGDAGDYIPTVEDTRIEKYIFCSIAVANATTVDITIPQSDTFIPMTQKGQPGGVASLDSSGKVPEEQLPEMDFIPDSEKGEAEGRGKRRGHPGGGRQAGGCPSARRRKDGLHQQRPNHRLRSFRRSFPRLGRRHHHLPGNHSNIFRVEWRHPHPDAQRQRDNG